VKPTIFPFLRLLERQQVLDWETRNQTHNTPIGLKVKNLPYVYQQESSSTNTPSSRIQNMSWLSKNILLVFDSVALCVGVTDDSRVVLTVTTTKDASRDCKSRRPTSAPSGN